jgi:hypothetical protein
MNEEKLKFDEVVKKVGEKLKKDVVEVEKVLLEMGCVFMDEEEEDGYIWVIESNDCLLDGDVVELYEGVLVEVCDEMGIEYIC